MAVVRAILKVFGEASGLKVNFRKSTAVLIRGSEEDTVRVAGMLQCDIFEFPCRYLGLQLAIKSLTHAEWQPMLDKVRHFMPAWQRGLIQRPGRLILVQSVVAARPVHHLMITEAPEWVLEDMNKWMRSFLLAGKDKCNGGQCLVAWDKICLPKAFGGLGIKKLEMASHCTTSSLGMAKEDRCSKAMARTSNDIRRGGKGGVREGNMP